MIIICNLNYDIPVGAEYNRNKIFLTEISVFHIVKFNDEACALWESGVMLNQN